MEQPGDAPSLYHRLRLLPIPVLLTLAGIMLASLLALALSELSVDTSAQHASQIGRIQERLEAATSFKNLVVDAETGQHGYLLTRDRRYLQPFEEATGAFDNSFDRLQKLTPAGPLRGKLPEIRRVAEERLAIAASTITLMDSDHGADALDLVVSGEGKAKMDRFRALIAEFERRSREELAELRRQSADPTLWSRIATFVFALLAFGLLVTVARLVMNEAMRQRNAAAASDAEAARMHKLIDQRTGELADLSSHLQSVTERDKAELARNLHDELGGLLTAARMDVSWLQGASKGLDVEFGQKLQQVNDSLSDAMDVKRRVVESLRPALLDHFGLPTALQAYFDDTCRKAGLHCVTNIPEELTELPEDLAIALFRVGQESLTNIVRHSNAKNVEITLAADDDNVSVVVRDDGSGFDPAGRRFRGSHGINGMRYRVQGLGGTFNINSRPGSGTTVEINVPRNRGANTPVEAPG